MSDLLDSLMEEHKSLLDHLLATEPSMAIVMEGTLAKVLLLAAASEVEFEFQQLLIRYYQSLVGERAIALEFVRNKAISRQYHTYFQWEESNANQFFGLFGAEFKATAKARVAADPELDTSIRGFLELGALRNQLVHQNYATVRLPKTADEIFSLYVSACDFLRLLPDLLISFVSSQVPS